MIRDVSMKNRNMRVVMTKNHKLYPRIQNDSLQIDPKEWKLDKKIQKDRLLNQVLPLKLSAPVKNCPMMHRSQKMVAHRAIKNPQIRISLFRTLSIKRLSVRNRRHSHKVVKSVAILNISQMELAWEGDRLLQFRLIFQVLAVERGRINQSSHLHLFLRLWGELPVDLILIKNPYYGRKNYYRPVLGPL